MAVTCLNTTHRGSSLTEQLYAWWTRGRDYVAQQTAPVHPVTPWSSPPTTSATNMCVGGLLGTPTIILVDSGLVTLALMKPMYLASQSHMGLRIDAPIFGHMQEGSRKAMHIYVTVPVLLTQEPDHQDFYCETATFYPPPEANRQWYTNNTLWDGQDCNPASHCCNNALAPWFRRTLQEKTTEDIEVRWCIIQELHRDRVGIELLELYVY